MLADTSDIHSLSLAQQRHADELTSVAADLTAATVSAEAFGSVGAGFLAALNDAMLQAAHHVTLLAERLAAATSMAGATADAYRTAEDHAGRAISMHGA